MKYKILLWDIDGTLLDTHEGVSNAVRHTLHYFGQNRLHRDILAMVHTPKIKDAFVQIAGLSEDNAQKATDIFRQRYLEYDLLKAFLYDKILYVLKNCKQSGILQAVATNKRQDCADKICAHFEIDQYCTPIFGGDRYNSFSKADLICRCISAHNIKDMSSIVMIGDTECDKKAAEQIGIDFIGVNYGFGFKNIAEYANEPYEILNLLEE